jgi:acyl-coenzyme A synthetase/AMP-(fatty) acid ligase
MKRGFGWYASYMAAIRLGVPVAPMTQDIKDVATQTQRNRDVLQTCRPCLVVVDEETPGSVLAACTEFRIETVKYHELLECSQEVPDNIKRLHDIRKTPLAYLYTGGSTRASKCVMISHQMAMHEMAGYPLVAPSMSYTDRVIQHSSTYWGATFLGQINIALAFGASIIFCANRTDLSEIIEKEQITVLGLVPSQLNAISAPCPSIRVVFTWGEKMSKQIAEKWKSKCVLIELLVSTEYWLCLYAINGEESFRILDLPSVKITADPDSQSLMIAGDCVTPFGYTNPELNVVRSGCRYFKTSDLVKIEGNRLRFLGRSDSMIKLGGEWKDLFVIEQQLCEMFGVEEACILSSPTVVAFIVLGSQFTAETIDRVRVTVLNEQYIKILYVKTLPRNGVTGKIDRQGLAGSLVKNEISKSSKKRVMITTAVWLGYLVGVLAVLLATGGLIAVLITPTIALYFLRAELPRVQTWVPEIIAIFAVFFHFNLPNIALIALTWYTFKRGAIVPFALGLGALLVPNLPIWIPVAIYIFLGQKTTKKISNFHDKIAYILTWVVSFYLGLPRQLERTDWRDPPQARKLRPPQFEKILSENAKKIWEPITRKNEEIQQIKTGLTTFIHDQIEVSEEEAHELGQALPQNVDGGTHQESLNEASPEPVSPLYAVIADIIARVYGRQVHANTLLTNLTSLAAVEATNLIRDATGRDVHVADILGSTTVAQLAELVDAKKFSSAPVSEKSEYKNSKFKCQLWGWGLPCVWVFEVKDAWIHYKSLQIAVQELAARHPALLAKPEEGTRNLSYFLNETLVVIGLVRYWSGRWLALARLLGWCLYSNWTHVGVSDREIRVGWKKIETEKELRDHILEKKRKPNFYPPTEVEVITMPGRAFIRLYVTHAFSDGSCVVPILKDLNELYSAHVQGRGIELPFLPPPNGLFIQQERLLNSLTSENQRDDSFYLCYNMDMNDCGDPASFGRIVILKESFVAVVQAAANRLSVPVDVLFLSAIVIALARLWGIEKCVEMALVVPLRDGPHEADVVGFLADQRNLDVPLHGGPALATLTGVVQTVHALRRARGWKIPEPFTNCERTLVNIVQANFPKEIVMKQELLIQQHELATGVLYRPMELYVEQIDMYMWSLKARCRLRDYSPEKFVRFCKIFKEVIFDLVRCPNTLVHTGRNLSA